MPMHCTVITTEAQRSAVRHVMDVTYPQCQIGDYVEIPYNMWRRVAMIIAELTGSIVEVRDHNGRPPWARNYVVSLPLPG
jgi:hypothetical protein